MWLNCEKLIKNGYKTITLNLKIKGKNLRDSKK